MNTTLTLLWALCASPLLAAQSFTFVDRTVEVGLREPIGDPWLSKHEVAIFDQHLSGGALVDLDGDGYPELILPAPRNAVPIDQQDQGGFYIIPNILHSSGTGRAFDWPNKTTFLNGGGVPGAGSEVTGILAADFNNDGDLDLLITCGGELNDLSKSLQDHLNAINAPPFPPSRNHLFLNNNSAQGNFSFTDSIVNGVDTTDPDLNTNLDGFGLSYTQSPDAIPSVPNPASGGYADINDPARTLMTEYPSNSSCAAAADVNRDGLLDIYIANGQTLNTGNLAGMQRAGQMDSLYLNLGDIDGDGFPEFHDVTYDRAVYQDLSSFDPPPHLASRPPCRHPSPMRSTCPSSASRGAPTPAGPSTCRVTTRSIGFLPPTASPSPTSMRMAGRTSS